MRPDKGSVTIWMLGLSILLLLFGGIAIDFWRGLSLQRELAAVADSAAVAGASGIDEEVYRNLGEVVLEPTRARSLAEAAIAFQNVELTSIEMSFGPGNGSVTVTIEGEVDLGLLGVFIDDDSPLVVRGTSTALPQLIP